MRSAEAGGLTRADGPVSNTMRLDCKEPSQFHNGRRNRKSKPLREEVESLIGKLIVANFRPKIE